MSNIQVRALTVLTIVNILVNTSQVVRCLQTCIDQQLDRLDTLQDNLFAQENYVVEYLYGLEELEPGYSFCFY
jgi:hypothetical protein